MQYHSSWPADSKNYFENVIKAHGGWAAWDQLESFEFSLKKFSGALVLAKGLGRSFQSPDKLVILPKQRRVDFIYKNRTDVFEDGKITLSPEKKTIEDGRTLFRKTTFEQWYPGHAAYFFGYAWVNYLSYPFILPKFELLDYTLDEKSSSFEIKFPLNFHTHSQTQKFYFNEQHMLYRHNYRAELAGPFVYAAHYTTDYFECQGLQIGFVRRVRPRIGKIVLPVYGIYGEIEF